MVDLTRDANRQVRARLLDLVLGRSGPASSGWLNAREPEFRTQITSAALDPFRGYANALRDSLADAVQVLDAFHVVKLGTQVVDEVRRRVQQEQLGRRAPRRPALPDRWDRPLSESVAQRVGRLREVEAGRR